MPDLKLTFLEGTYAIHRLPAQAAVPEAVLASPFYAIMRTADELSVVAPVTVEVPAERTDAGWACFKVEAVLDLSLVGILAELAAVLASSQVAIFALSSFNTDYLLVKGEQAGAATQALAAAGYRIANMRRD
jgi:hypothetical protein